MPPVLKSRAITVALTATLLLGFGCRDDDDEASGETTTSTATESTTTSSTAQQQELELTVGGYGPLRLGTSLDDASQTGFMGETRPGCELGGPGEVVGTIVGTERGAAYFNDGELTGISLDQGATTEGIRVGSTLDEIEQTYSTGGFTVAIDDSTEEVFGIVLATVEKNATPAYAFTLDPQSQQVQTLWVPTARFCD
jgi:hypothetical protein